MIVVISHAHPSVSKGGAEVSAYTLYSGLKEMGVQAAFVAMVPEGDAGRVVFATPDEYIIPFRPDDYDHVFHSTGPNIYDAAEKILENIKPTALIFHHFLNLGINAVRDLVDKFKCPSAMVLHEFLAICHHHGQMVTHPQKRLCKISSASACATCFPEYSPEHFHVRKSLFQSTFDRIDRLISPSQFLADRFVEWGVAPQKLAVIENGLIAHVSPTAERLSSEESRGTLAVLKPVADVGSKRKRVLKADLQANDQNTKKSGAETIPKVFGYFGQINPFKGMDLLLDALDILKKQGFGNLRLRVHGNVVGVSDEFRKRFENASEKSGLIDYQGAYNNADVLKLMGECDYVVMASKWWENSPVVIQEAFAAHRPLLVPDIGGMAEKVKNGEAGRHFRFGDAVDLARVLKEASTESPVYSLPRPSTAREMAQAYTALLPPR